MALHWGHGIAIFYSFFVCTVVIVLVKSTGFDNSLVTEQYYARDINYQQEFDRRSNSQQLGEAGPRVDCTAGVCRLSFLPEMAPDVSGSLLLYRASSQRFDRTLALKLDTAGGMDLPLTGLPPGRYQAILEWSAGGTRYYDELDMYH